MNFHINILENRLKSHNMMGTKRGEPGQNGSVLFNSFDYQRSEMSKKHFLSASIEMDY